MIQRMHIRIKKGLDIPVPDLPSGEIQPLPLPSHLALDLSPFETLVFKILKKEGEKVTVGEPLAYDKSRPERLFISPASGRVSEVVRGFKRHPLSIIVETDGKQTPYSGKQETLFEAGLAPHIQVRPGLRIARSDQKPEAIFVKAIESAPYAPPPELQVQGYEISFAAGLDVLKEYAPVHLVCRSGFQDYDVHIHTAEGPHPIGNASVHIAALHPITDPSQVVWTLGIQDVIALGRWKQEKKVHTERVISVAGKGYFRGFVGHPLRELIQGDRIISGDPLMGVERDYLGFYHVCALKNPEPKREFLPFLKFKRKEYTASKTYFFRKKTATLSPLMHGEERAFIDGSIYDRVMPLPIETVALIKMLITEEYDKGEALGLLGVHPEDFALPTYICPSKIEMTEIVKEGLNAYAKQYLD